VEINQNYFPQIVAAAIKIKYVKKEEPSNKEKCRKT